MLSYAKVSLTATMASIVWIVGRLALVADELFGVARACRPRTTVHPRTARHRFLEAVDRPKGSPGRRKTMTLYREPVILPFDESALALAWRATVRAHEMWVRVESEMGPS
jgi:hypothetical protein